DFASFLGRVERWRGDEVLHGRLRALSGFPLSSLQSDANQATADGGRLPSRHRRGSQSGGDEKHRNNSRFHRRSDAESAGAAALLWRVHVPPRLPPWGVLVAKFVRPDDSPEDKGILRIWRHRPGGETVPMSESLSRDDARSDCP